MTFQAKVWTGLIVVAAVGAGTYLFVEKSQQIAKKKNLTAVVVNIDNNCIVSPKDVTIHVDQSQVHWQAGTNGAKIKFSDTPFQDGSIFVITGASAIDSGLTNQDADDCANTPGKTCEDYYTVTVSGKQCTDPKVIVSK